MPLGPSTGRGVLVTGGSESSMTFSARESESGFGLLLLLTDALCSEGASTLSGPCDVEFCGLVHWLEETPVTIAPIAPSALVAPAAVAAALPAALLSVMMPADANGGSVGKPDANGASSGIKSEGRGSWSCCCRRSGCSC